jgi:hypothetical protein
MAATPHRLGFNRAGVPLQANRTSDANRPLTAATRVLISHRAQNGSNVLAAFLKTTLRGFSQTVSHMHRLFRFHSVISAALPPPCRCRLAGDLPARLSGIGARATLIRTQAEAASLTRRAAW